MADKKVVLVTGVSNEWGSKVAKQLIERKADQYHVIGLDTEPPVEEIKDLDFIQADIRNPLMLNLLQSESVDTVCHLVFQESLRPNEAVFDQNVMGTMKVLVAGKPA